VTQSESIDVRPVAAAEKEAFGALFEGKGCPGFCWCTPYRFQDAPQVDRDKKREAMLGLIDDGPPGGVLTFDGNEPVGWCSVGCLAALSS